MIIFDFILNRLIEIKDNWEVTFANKVEMAISCNQCPFYGSVQCLDCDEVDKEIGGNNYV